MCGFCGIKYLTNSLFVEKEHLCRMNLKLTHRGPDSDGFYITNECGLSFRRLAILDLSADGNQPMTNEDGSIWIVFNGEFYGFQKYREQLIKKGHTFKSKTDTETILHLYEEYGINCLQYIDGMFAFALWDNRNKQLYLVRDRLGIKPLYYYIDKEKIIFGSEIKAILEYPGIKKEINYQALHNYLSFMTIPAPLTIYNNIYKLLPGNYLTHQNGNVITHEYWDLKEEEGDYNEKYYIEELEVRFKKAVESYLISDVPIGAFLSGGVDSSAVVAMMSVILKSNVKTFSINFEGLNDYNEQKFSELVSSLYNTEHYTFNLKTDLISVLPKIVWYFDEPFAVSSAIGIYYLAKLAKEKITVALTGDGADELFAGYPFRYSMDNRYKKISKIPKIMRNIFFRALRLLPLLGNESQRNFVQKVKNYSKFFNGSQDDAFFNTYTFFDESIKRSLYTFNFSNGLYFEPSINVIKHYYNKINITDPIKRRLYGDIKTTLVDEMLTKVDKMSMAWSLESRVPFLDHELVEFVFNIPSKYKLQNREGKIILKKMLEKYLPNEILYRKKHGFNVPMDKWFRFELYDYLNDILSENTIKKRGIFNYEIIKKMIELHKNYKANYAGELNILLNFELWYREYIGS